jgi:hypothetical protein
MGPEDYYAWTVPTPLLKEGANKIVITMTQGTPVQLFYLDLALVPSSH